jgi:hypothetical protein
VEGRFITNDWKFCSPPRSEPSKAFLAKKRHIISLSVMTDQEPMSIL